MTNPNASTSDPKDGKKQLDWDYHYPAEARKKIQQEVIYLTILFFVSFLTIFVIWADWFSSLVSFTPTQSIIFKKYSYYSLSGLLGGAIFGIKMLYRYVARGYWHLNRRIWRFMSPLVGMAIAFVIGAMIDASFINFRETLNGSTIVVIGFLAGYFADEAVGKMYEVASVIFGKSAMFKDGDEKKE